MTWTMVSDKESLVEPIFTTLDYKKWQWRGGVKSQGHPGHSQHTTFLDGGKMTTEHLSSGGMSSSALSATWVG